MMATPMVSVHSSLSVSEWYPYFANYVPIAVDQMSDPDKPIRPSRPRQSSLRQRARERKPRIESLAFHVHRGHDFNYDQHCHRANTCSGNEETVSSYSIASQAGGVSPSHSYEALYFPEARQGEFHAENGLEIEGTDLESSTGNDHDQREAAIDRRKRSSSALGKAGKLEPSVLIDRRSRHRNFSSATKSFNHQANTPTSKSPNQSSLPPGQHEDSGALPSTGKRASCIPERTIAGGMLLQPETHPITEEQLINEVRGIYAGLVMVEKKCMEIDRQQSQSPNKLSDLQWQALTALHRTLLHEHHDFFLASQHPSASPVLQGLAEKYAMPARMWRYGIHSFLELLRYRLPGSLEHMLTFIYITYSMMTLLLESVPAFEDTWIECLGDLARYRMAVKENDMRDLEVWSGVARYWYHKAADKSPDIGRIQHHLAVLARPNIIQQLFYYTKSLVSVHGFPSAKESILLLFNSLLDPAKAVNSRHPPLIVAFVHAHGILFTKGLVRQYIRLVDKFLSLLDKHIGRVGAIFREQGVHIASSNYAAIFEYGQPDGILPAMFDQKIIQLISPLERHKSARRFWETSDSRYTSFQTEELVSEDTNFTHSKQILSYASHLTFSTLGVILERLGDKNVLPNVHISLAFLWCSALNPESMMCIQTDVPWARIVCFLNMLIRHDTNITKIEGEEFPCFEIGTAQQLPEDFLIRGQAWSQLYYPENFFGDISDDAERSIELPSVIVPRTHRCLWLGIRIAKLEKWITYDYHSKKFSTTSFSVKLENTARETNLFNRPSKTLSPELCDEDIKMGDVRDENTNSQMYSGLPDNNPAISD